MENLFNKDELKFADILLPLPLDALFTYRVPTDLLAHVHIGMRVIVPFGERKITTGVIIQLHQQANPAYEAKYIADVLDEKPSITPQQIELLFWIADYYACTPGEVLQAALPSGLKLSSESYVQIHLEFSFESSRFEFSAREEIILEKVKDKAASIPELSSLLNIKNISPIVNGLIKKEAIVLVESIEEKYKPKLEKRIRFTENYLLAENLELLFKRLNKKPKQEEVLLAYLRLVNVLQDSSVNVEGVQKEKVLAEEVSASSLQKLIKDKVFEEFSIEVSRFSDFTEDVISPKLSETQIETVKEIHQQWQEKNTILLHGITGSGKTEIYCHLIKQVIDAGGQTLFMLPEIALTTQLVNRLKNFFGDALGVYHSRFNENERVEVYQKVLKGEYQVIVGVRSSIFLPFQHLGLIVVDEEHEVTYKQQEPAPRYHARDCAIMLASFHHAKVLLGSATPALETYYQAKQGKFGYVRITERYSGTSLPLIHLADMKLEKLQKKNKGDFSGLLLTKIEESLQKQEQAIIFQNRRGYSPSIQCEVCQWVATCPNCAVSLTYHQFRKAMVCHYCGYKEKHPTQCPSCQSKRLSNIGYGTEKLEEELKIYFPDNQIQRMDLDTTRNKKSFDQIIEDFETGKTQILIGTQMITKGLDFNRVQVVGIFNADRMLYFPDFRSHERAFQLITQVSGRAGRREKQGEVVIQTSNPNHLILEWIKEHDYDKFASHELQERQNHDYPPFSRLIEITVKHIDFKISRQASEFLTSEIRRIVQDVKVLGPGEPMIGKIRNQYLMTTLIKIPRNNGKLQEIKASIKKLIQLSKQQSDFKNARFILDVDPV
ncbi:MAG: primosomal protein N' [Chryseotalea sp.]